MHSGMLWFDNDPKTALTTKIEKAAGYYRQKYGRNPDLCLVHPSMLGGNNILNNNERLGGDYPEHKEILATGMLRGRSDQNDTGRPLHDNCKIEIRPYRPILPGHLWIGIDESHFKEEPKR